MPHAVYGQFEIGHSALLSGRVVDVSDRRRRRPWSGNTLRGHAAGIRTGHATLGKRVPKLGRQPMTHHHHYPTHVLTQQRRW